MSMNVDSQSNLLTEKLNQMAIGQLYQNLDFVQTTRRWATRQKIENGGSFAIPTLGTVASNVRAPGGQVVDQTPAPTKQTIPVIEREVTIPMDPTWLSSEGDFYFAEQQMMSAINALSEDVMNDILSAIATTGGLNAVGTLGATLTKADFDAARKFLTDAALPRNGRSMIVSPDMMTDLTNIPEYSDYDKSGIGGSNPQGYTRAVSGFEVLESAYTENPAAGQHIGFACHPESVNTVFPMQETFTDGSNVKSEVAKDGLRLYILDEYRPQYNGMRAWTFSVRFGAAVGRPDGVVLVNGK